MQFITTTSSTVEEMVKNGLTLEQANLYIQLPLWMTTSFAIGVFGGLIGSVLLLMRKKIATPVFAVSLIGYILLYIGDIVESVFQVFGTPQVIVLTTVVLIALILFIVARYFSRNGKLQ